MNDYQKACVGVVVLGSRTSETHLFHSECLQGHYDSQAGRSGGPAGHYKCMICQKAYGTRTGDMPPGSMS